MTQTLLKFQKLTPTAMLPTKATTGAACYDLYSDEDAYLDDTRTFRIIRTGIAMELPPGYAGLVCSRSGLAAKDGMFVLNAPGIIDEDYRGELKVVLGRMPFTPQWPSDKIFEVRPGMRIAQLLVVALPQLYLTVTDNLSASERGNNGFGSTGV